MAKKYINRKLTLKEQIEEKQKALGLEEIINTEFDGNELNIFKYKNTYRSYLAIKLLVTPDLLSGEDAQQLQQEWKDIMRYADKTKMYAVKKSPNFSDMRIGLEDLVIDTPNKQLVYDELVKEFDGCNIILEYYISLEFSSIDKLEEQMTYLTRSKYQFFQVKYPTKSERDYIYQELVLGGLNIKYQPDCIIYNYQQEDQYYVKFIAVNSIKSKQKTHYWQSLTRPRNSDFLLEIDYTDHDKAVRFSDRVLTELEEQYKGAEKKKAKSSMTKIEQELAITKPVLDKIIANQDFLIDARFLVRFYGTDLAQLNKDIKIFKKDNRDKFTFVEKNDSYEQLEKYWLGVNNKIVPNQSLTLDLLTAGAGLFFSTYIQDKGILLCNRRNTITMVNREEVRQEDGQMNYSEFISGDTGSGKSVTMKKFISYAMLSKNDKVVVLDVQSEYIKLCKLFNGTVINISSGRSNITLNPFELIINEEGIIEYKKVAEFLALLSPSIKEDNRFREQVINYLINICPQIEEPITLTRFYNKFKELLDNKSIEASAEAQQFIVSLENIIKSYPMFDGETDVDLENRFIVFNLMNISGDQELKLAVNYIILRLVTTSMYGNKFVDDLFGDGTSLDELKNLIKYAESKNIDIDDFDIDLDEMKELSDNDLQDVIGKLKEYIQANTGKIRLVVDEAQNILDEPTITSFLLKIASEGRKFRVGVMLATQSPAELYGGPTEEIRLLKQKLAEKIPYKYFLKTPNTVGLNVTIANTDTGVTKPLFTPSEIMFLTSQARAGEGFVMYNGQNHLIGVQVSPRLINFFDGGTE